MIQTEKQLKYLHCLLDKYEYLTGEDLDIKPSTIEQAKFEYSPLDKILNKGLSEDDKKEGILKRLENIKDKNDKLLNTFNKTNKFFKNKTNKTKNQYIMQSIVLQSLEILATLKNYHSILCLTY